MILPIIQKIGPFNCQGKLHIWVNLCSACAVSRPGKWAACIFKIRLALACPFYSSNLPVAAGHPFFFLRLLHPSGAPLRCRHGCGPPFVEQQLEHWMLCIQLIKRWAVLKVKVVKLSVKPSSNTCVLVLSLDIYIFSIIIGLWTCHTAWFAG
jgi:hypothetical protein